MITAWCARDHSTRPTPTKKNLASLTLLSLAFGASTFRFAQKKNVAVMTC